MPPACARRSPAATRRDGSKLTYLEVAQDFAEHEQELIAQKNRQQEAESALAVTREQRRQAEAKYRRTGLIDLAQAEQKARSLGEELAKAAQRHQLQTLTAPVDGTVQQLAVHIVGGVVTAAQPLLVVVPAESRLEIEAMVQNRDIGFVQPGQAANIKVDTFNFTKYGLLHGQVLAVSQDAITRDKPQERTGDKSVGTGEARNINFWDYGDSLLDIEQRRSPGGALPRFRPALAREERPAEPLLQGGEAGLDRVERDVAGGGDQMRLVHRHGAEAALEQVPGPAETRVDGAGELR